MGGPHHDTQSSSPEKYLMVVKDGGRWPTTYQIAGRRDFIYSSAMAGDIKAIKKKFQGIKIPQRYKTLCTSPANSLYDTGAEQSSGTR